MVFAKKPTERWAPTWQKKWVGLLTKLKPKNSVSNFAELPGLTDLFMSRPDLMCVTWDADPCQRQLLGPFVLAKSDSCSGHRRVPSPPAIPLELYVSAASSVPLSLLGMVCDARDVKF